MHDLRQFTLTIIANGESAAHLNERNALAPGTKEGVNTESIVGRAVGEAENRTECVGKPRRSRRAGVLHRRGAHWMLEGFLRFAIVIESELVHCGVVDSPRMADVPLLESLVGDGSEPWHVRAGSLELRKR